MVLPNTINAFQYIYILYITAKVYGFFTQQELLQLQRSHAVARCIIAVNVFRVAKYIGPSSGFYICAWHRHVL